MKLLKKYVNHLLPITQSDILDHIDLPLLGIMLLSEEWTPKRYLKISSGNGEVVRYTKINSSIVLVEMSAQYWKIYNISGTILVKKLWLC